MESQKKLMEEFRKESWEEFQEEFGQKWWEKVNTPCFILNIYSTRGSNLSPRPIQGGSLDRTSEGTHKGISKQGWVDC